MDHFSADSAAQNQRKGLELKKRNSPSLEPIEISPPSCGFDCNICLDLVQDPVVTLCGHLYCWPCIYKWINLHSSISSSEMSEPQEAPQCPVCKSEISESTLVPLYVPNSTLKQSDDDEKSSANPDPCTPGRPKGPSIGSPSSNHTVTPRQIQNQTILPQPPSPYGAEFAFSSPHAFNLVGSTRFHPVISMFGELLSARRFRDGSQPLYTNLGSYSDAATSNARARRQVVQADHSLSRLSFFLCCCLVLCLLLL